MNEQHSQALENRPRVPGVRYRKETRYRTEITTIDGVSEERRVPYTVEVPQPPVDIDQLIVRGVTVAACVATLATMAGTVASIGGLLSGVIPAEVAYSVVAVFDVTWLCCTGMEYVHRFHPQRAEMARSWGWFSLVVGMLAIGSYGWVEGIWEAGVAAAMVPLLNKGLWKMVIDSYAPPLSPGVSNWLRRREERQAAQLAVAGQLRRLDRHGAYMTAVYGPQAARAAAVTTFGEAVPAVGVDASGREPEPARTVPVQDSAPPPAPVVMPSAPLGPVSGPASAQAGAPAPAAPVVQPGPALASPAAPAPSTLMSVAGAVRHVIADKGEQISDTDLIDEAAKLVGKERAENPKFAETVLRNRRAKNNTRSGRRSRSAP